MMDVTAVHETGRARDTDDDLLAILLAPTPTIPTLAPVSRVPRNYYRCIDCLAVCAVEGKLRDVRKSGDWWPSYGECGQCGGRIEHMGEVYRDRLTRLEDQCPCDDRCTSARGPSCDCRCGGKNHGSNMVVTVRMDMGAIPVLTIDNPKAATTAREYRTLAEQVRSAWDTRYGAVTRAKQRGEYLANGDFSRYLEAGHYSRKLGQVRELRSHAGRMKKLTSLLQELSA